MNIKHLFLESGGSRATRNTIKTPAFGRPFRVGMLYDRVHDNILPGETFMTLKEIENHTFIAKKEGCSFDVSYGDSSKDKSAVYKGDANLELNVLKGAASLGCSGRFLKNNISKKNQLRVSLTAQYITLYKELAMTHFDSHISNTTTNATHIVTAIEYGANVTFAFDRIVSEKENKMQVSGELNGMIDKIPSFKVSGDAKGSLDKIDETKTENIACTFCGDVILPTNPTTYEDAVICYKKLPSYLSDDKAVPVNVWLHPIQTIASPLNQVLKKNDKENMSQIIIALDNLQEMYVLCNELISGQAVAYIPEVRHKIKTFREILRKTRADFQSQVLGENSKADDLCKLSGFQSKIDRMQTWILQDAKVEIDMLNMYCNALKKGKVEIITVPDIDSKLLQHDYVLILYIDLPFRNRPYGKLPEACRTNLYHSWYNRSDLTYSTHRLVKYFANLKSKTSTGFELFVSFSSLGNTEGACFQFEIYENGQKSEPIGYEDGKTFQIKFEKKLTPKK